MTVSEAPSSFRLAYVPGATPAKWVRVWNERLPQVPLALLPVSAAEAEGVLRRGEADAGLVRLPVDRAELSAIPLYTETTVVLVPKDHVVTAVEEVSVADLADEIVLSPLDDTLGWERPPGVAANERPATTADAVDLVAAGVGVLVVPQSIARLHHRKDLTYRPVVDAPESRVALSWPEERTTDLVEEFIGIVRGRTVNSTRGRTAAQAPAPADKKQRGRPGAGAGRGSAGGAAGGGGRRGGAAGRTQQGGKSGGKAGGKSGGKAGAKHGKPRRRP
ncbi:LysR substrate-binding domain-containing protein [Streptomyces uncialis]|uniref:LysR family transcriptional regulator n=1 Tax=Streptomyces uncialis TaxID=1048205 RepID=A0A1Q4VAN6_9ACTN|nr:LysR substrate-binding domain-containing protein [Streptomyces uncialis]OKH94873.1 LysR family transcriptional regulator [Streptomyces uncialis]